MTKLQTFKDHAREVSLYTNRAIVALLGIGFLLFVLIARLFYLQVFMHETYTTLSDNNRVNVVPITPNRGLILDRKGRVLAENIPAYSLEIIPEQVDNLEETIKKLSRIIAISEQDKENFHKQLRMKRRFEGVPIRFQLTEEELAAFAVNRYQLPGVDIAAGLLRHYPYENILAHALGYVGRINENELKTLDDINYSATQYIGKTGVEKFYESQLHGKVGYQQVETNARGRIVRILNKTPPNSGKNLQLSLDIDLQTAAMEVLDGHKGSIVMLDTKTGGILALASNPAYDPNQFVNGLDTETFHELQYSPAQPLFNRALRGQYPPGSTIKPILGLKAIANHTINGTEKFYDPGWYKLENEERLFRDWRRHGHGWLDLTSAIAQSCTTYFYDLAHKMGINSISEVLSDFGFGQDTEVDIASESSGLVPSVKWKSKKMHQPWYPGETLITGIGQGYTLVTPIQLAKMVATVANRGYTVNPHIVQAILDGEDTSAKIENVLPPKKRISIESEHAWNMIQKAMRNVTQDKHGTAYWSFVNAKYQVAAKTGTAQVSGIKQGEKYEEDKLEKRLRDHSLFIAFMPAQAPEVAMAIVLENEKGSSKLARKVLDKYYQLEHQQS